MEDKVKNLQDNLKYLRMACGVSATEFSKHLGVTRQMVNSLENKRNNMTLMQYHAIMHVLEDIYGMGGKYRCYAMVDCVYAVLMFDSYSDEYKEYVRKGVLMFTPSVIQGCAILGDVEEAFRNYILKFEG